MRHIKPILLAAIISIIVQCTPKQVLQPVVALTSNPEGNGQTLELKFKAGKAHNHPTFAIWIANQDSSYLQTLFVTTSLAKGMFEHATIENGKWKAAAIQRKATLPVWLHKLNVKNASGGLTPDSTSAIPDAYTGATPVGGFTLSTKLDKRIEKTIIVFLEVNQTWDWNEYWTNNKYPNDADYKTSCQPALIYATLVDPTAAQTEYTFTLIGHSHYSGNDGYIYPDVSTITTAKNIFETIKLTVK
jgi:hypothetical protein